MTDQAAGAGRASRPRASDAVIVAVTTAAAALVVANVSTLNVALPVLSTALNASQTDLQWMVDAYAVVLASLLLPFGAIGDRYGRRNIMLVGLVILCATNGLTPLTDSARGVIIARALSGVSAALVFPATLSTITATLADEHRERGIAIWTAAVGVGGVVSVVSAGVAIESFWWGSVFVLMGILSAVMLIAAWLFVPDTSDPADAGLDPIGALLSLVSVGAVVLAIIEGPTRGWGSGVTIAGFVIGVASAAAFVRWEFGRVHPLLDVRVFKSRGVRSGSLSILVQFIVAFGFLFVSVSYLAFSRSYGPLDLGLALVPISCGLFPASIASFPLARRFSRRALGSVGLLIMTASFVFGTQINDGSGLWMYIVVLIVFGAGFGFSAPPETSAIVESLPAAKQGVASALNDVLRELGAALGIAVAGAVFNDAYRHSIDTSTAVPDSVRDAVRDAPASAGALAPTVGDAGTGLLSAVSGAVIEGWQTSMWVLAAITFAGALGFVAWSPGRRT